MARKKDISGSERKYTRRQFLISGAKTAAGAGIYGAVGGILGKGYGVARDGFRYLEKSIGNVGNKLTNLDNRVNEIEGLKQTKKVEEKRSNFWRDLFGRTEEDQARARERFGIEHPKGYEPPETKKTYPLQKTEKPEGISRRGILSRIFSLANEYPVETGATIGAVYGGGKSALKSGTRIKEARLKDRIENLEERVSSREDNEKNGPKRHHLLVFGFAGIILSMVIGYYNINGLVIENFSPNNMNIIGVITFIISIFLLYLYIK